MTQMTAIKVTLLFYEQSWEENIHQKFHKHM